MNILIALCLDVSDIVLIIELYAVILISVHSFNIL